MKQLITILILTIFALILKAQDIDFYHKTTNELFIFPPISNQMTVDEFQLLSRTLRMKDFMYAAIVPGYVHFQSKDFAIGYSVLSLRLTAYGLLGYESYKYGFNLYNAAFKYATLNINSMNKTDLYIINCAIGTIITTMLFDWIDGQARLHKKQELIRYKYSLKMQLYSQTTGIQYTGIGVRIKF